MKVCSKLSKWFIIVIGSHLPSVKTDNIIPGYLDRITILGLIDKTTYSIIGSILIIPVVLTQLWFIDNRLLMKLLRASCRDLEITRNSIILKGLPYVLVREQLRWINTNSCCCIWLYSFRWCDGMDLSSPARGPLEWWKTCNSPWFCLRIPANAKPH